jgi:hypothetical protein
MKDPALGGAGSSGKRPFGIGDSPELSRTSPRTRPSDAAILAGYSLALVDINSHCRYAGKEFNRAANDFANLDEDMAIDSFRRTVALAKAAGELIVAIESGGPSPS